jgi:hypothetical protein
LAGSATMCGVNGDGLGPNPYRDSALQRSKLANRRLADMDNVRSRVLGELMLMRKAELE